MQACIGDNDEFDKRLKKYERNISAFIKNGVNLFLSGGDGSGRTTAGCAILKEACRQGFPGLFVSAADIGNLIIQKQRFSSNYLYEDRLRSVKVLCIDNLCERHNAYETDIISKIIHHRIEEKLLSILITNLSLNEFQDVFGDIVSNAIASSSVIISLTGRNFLKQRVDAIGTFFAGLK